MEVPALTLETQEKIFIEFNLFYNTISYKCSFYDINNKKIKMNIISNDNVDKFEKILDFDDFKKLNKYFKMFDSLNELEKDLLGLINSKKNRNFKYI